MNKDALKDKLISIQEAVIGELVEKMEYSHSMVDIDEEDVKDPEDLSHQWESGEMEQLMKVQLNKAKNCMTKLLTINFSVKDKAVTGAYVETDQMNFFVGLSTLPFEFENKNIIGISEESPIYAIMAGKSVGEQFSFSGKTYSITKIY